MKFIFLFQFLVLSNLANAQFQQINIDSFRFTTAFEDTISLSEISVKKALFIIVNGKSCTACKMTLSKYIASQIDTNSFACYILILNIKSSLAKQLASANFTEQFPFAKNVLFYSNTFERTFPLTQININETLSGPSPSLWLMNMRQNKSLVLHFTDLFTSSTTLSEKSKQIIGNF